jgi:hypothetical protein
MTYRLLHIGSLIGHFAAMLYKAEFHVPRPPQLLPALLPPIPVPGHASYPSGHGTQSHLMTRCIAHLVSLELSAADAAVIVSDLTELANVIARNREIAGLHYPSDSVAGQLLAAPLFNTLNSAHVPLFGDAVTAARSEWG